MANEPGDAVLALFDQLIDRIKQRDPNNTGNAPVGSRVYSQLVLGMPIYREDYLKPWSPSGGASMREATPPAADEAALAADPQMLRAMQAAWKTSLLCKLMLKVTRDETYTEYPLGRHLDFAYSAVLDGMTSTAPPEEPEELQTRRLNALKLLYKTEADGSMGFTKTPLYEAYLKNAEALADAKAEFAIANAQQALDPAKHQAWPVAGQKYQRAVQRARETLAAEGAQQVEQALATIRSIGMPAEQQLIARAKDSRDDWNLGLTGVVPGNSPYSLILPTNWCDPDDHDGWEMLTVKRSSYSHYDSSQTTSGSASHWERHARSTSGGGGVMFGFAAFGASGGSSSSDSAWQTSSNSHFVSKFSNTATNLSIELEYGLCTIVRPWLISDLFYVRNWYLRHQKKLSISDGTINGQVDSQDKLLPMIPQQFLVVRNVKISTSTWGSDGDALNDYYGSAQGSSEERASRIAGTGGVSLGFVSFGGTAARSESEARADSSFWSARSSSEHFGTTFDGETLHIPGAQIVAFLSDITPASPNDDDPALTP